MLPTRRVLRVVSTVWIKHPSSRSATSLIPSLSRRSSQVCRTHEHGAHVPPPTCTHMRVCVDIKPIRPLRSSLRDKNDTIRRDIARNTLFMCIFGNAHTECLAGNIHGSHEKLEELWAKGYSAGDIVQVSCSSAVCSVTRICEHACHIVSCAPVQSDT